jgi:hypothetical protein
MKRGHKSGHIRAAVILHHQFFFARAGEMNHLECSLLQRRQGFDYGVVNSSRALAAAHHQQRRGPVIKAELSARKSPFDPAQFGANGRAGHFRFHFRKKWRALFKSEQDCPHDSRGQLVGLAGNCVGFVNESGHTAQFSRQHRRGRSEAAHPEDGLRFEAAIDRAAAHQTLVEATNKAENGRGKRRGHSDDGQFFHRNFRMLLQRQHIHFFFGDEEQDLVPAFAQHFRNRDPGKQMPARPSTCDDSVHDVNSECRIPNAE